ncbi:hypothetical protein [Nocardia brasiliensis]|uniref:hypothetical protein n=1 Tax=Nocardia brasiliensis TaxID=37326 RepID=UPI002457042F|nr:hypothetical protein [Nocardia brasiliensis]
MHAASVLADSSIIDRLGTVGLIVGIIIGFVALGLAGLILFDWISEHAGIILRITVGGGLTLLTLGFIASVPILTVAGVLGLVLAVVVLIIAAVMD